MENALATTNANAVMTFDRDKIELIKRTVAKNATDDQLALFLHQAQRTGLDPLARQIHCIMRWNSKDQRHDMSIQTAIDGYRLIADRTGKYAGSDDYLFDEGLTQYQMIQEGRKPTTATVTVYKLAGGIRAPFTATAVWESYYPGDKQGFMWRKMPYLMLGKCAEALALRKAFPAELSGVYIREEMEQAGYTGDPDDFNQDVYPDEYNQDTRPVDGEIVETTDVRGKAAPDEQKKRDPRERHPSGLKVGDAVTVAGNGDEKPGTVIGFNGGGLVIVNVEGQELKLKTERLTLVDLA